MPSALTALFATAIHEARNADADPTGLNRVATLLVTAAGARRVEWRQSGGHLRVSGTPVPNDSPGAGLIMEALAAHGITAVGLPAGLNVAQWSAVATILAAARGLHPSPDHIRTAIGDVVPSATVLVSTTSPADDPDLAAVLREIPDMSAFSDAGRSEAPMVSARDTERSEFSGVIDPLLDEGRVAVAAFDWNRTAQVLLQLAELAAQGGEGNRAIVLRERRRLLPESALQRLVREYQSAGQGSLIERALGTLGADGVEAVLEVLAARPGKAQHRHYLELLTGMTGAEAPLVKALGSHRDHLVRDAAEVLGRRRVEAAVPMLGSLLRNGNEEIRMAAWRALENIGTAEAMALIR